MKHPRPHREPRDLCAQLHEDDGVDSRKENRDRAQTERSFTLADRRLCKLARRAIDVAMLGFARDPVLSRLHAHSVTFERGRLVVVLTPDRPLDEEELNDARARAGAARGTLRAAVAHSIVRKRTPDLSLDVSPCPLTTGVEDE
jgi:hypothetical protein